MEELINWYFITVTNKQLQNIFYIKVFEFRKDAVTATMWKLLVVLAFLSAVIAYEVNRTTPAVSQNSNYIWGPCPGDGPCKCNGYPLAHPACKTYKEPFYQVTKCKVRLEDPEEKASDGDCPRML